MKLKTMALLCTVSFLSACAELQNVGTSLVSELTGVYMGGERMWITREECRNSQGKTIDDIAKQMGVSTQRLDTYMREGTYAIVYGIPIDRVRQEANTVEQFKRNVQTRECVLNVSPKTKRIEAFSVI